MRMQYENIDTAVIDAESLPWIPFLPYADNVFLKLLKVDAVRGEWITLLKVPEDMQLPKHHHSGTVMVYTISGTWRYLEHDWTAGPGSFVFETAGTQHTPVGCNKGEIVTLNIVQGDWNLIGPEGQVLAIENWKSMVQRYLDYCQRTDTQPVDVTSFAV
jgi:2,4'-dihydroxyacetophenone dioxygenase